MILLVTILQVNGEFRTNAAFGGWCEAFFGAKVALLPFFSILDLIFIVLMFLICSICCCALYNNNLWTSINHETDLDFISDNFACQCMFNSL